MKMRGSRCVSMTVLKTSSSPALNRRLNLGGLLIMYIGIDLGGTNIAAAVVDKKGAIIKRAGVPTSGERGADAVIEGLLRVCDMLMENGEQPLSIGIGVPGIVNSEAGEVVFTPNLPLSGVNIVSKLKEKHRCPIYLGNDANCAALGETIAGGAKGAKDVVFITLGTGIGGGIIVGGKLVTGINGAAGELGHMVIEEGGRKCGCGRLGCWETYASASGIKETAIDAMKKHEGSLLWELCDGQTAMIEGRLIFEAYRAGDELAKLIVEWYVARLATGIVSIINILQPEMFCIGGGISNAWDCLETPLVAAVEAEIITRFSKKSPQTRIVKATLGNDAGIIGAALLGHYSF